MRAQFPTQMLSMLLALSVGCTEPVVNERFHAQQELGETSITSAALRVTIDPGGTPIVDPTVSNCGESSRFRVVAPFRLRFRSSGPTPTVVLEHGDRDDVNIEAIFQNTFVDGRFVPTVGTLVSSSCANATGFDGIMLAPLPHRSFGANARSSCLQVPRCSRVKIEVLPPAGLGEIDGDELRVAVIGEVHGDESTFESAVEAITEWEAHLLISMGNLTESAGLSPIRRWRQIADEIGLPFVTVLGENEAEGGAYLPFHELFGRSDFTFSVGDVRFLVMDTASAEFSDEQLAYWDSVLEKADEPIVIALTHTPPLDPAGFRDAGFISRTEAAMLLTLLGEHDVTALLTGGVGTFLESRQAGVPVYSTGGGGDEIESGDEVGRHYVRLTIRLGEDEALSVSTGGF